MFKSNVRIALVIAVLAVALAGGWRMMRRHKGPVGLRSVSAATPEKSSTAASNATATSTLTSTPGATPEAAAPEGDSNPNAIRFVKNPEMAPPLNARDIQGRPVTKANWSGKVVLINFWATWCPPCRAEIPELLELKKEYGDKFEIIGISEDDDSPAKVLKFVQQKAMTYPVVMYTPELVAAYGGVPALPTSFLIDTQGRVVQKHSGLYPIESYQQEINALLGMPVNGPIETFTDTGQIFLKNAANATELPGVSFKGLTDEQKKLALHRMNAESCTCGCKLTLSQCRVNDSECPISEHITDEIVSGIARGEKTPPAPRSKGAATISQ